MGLEEVQRVTVMPTELGGTGTQMNMTLQPTYRGDLPLWLHHKSRESGERSDGRYETVLPIHSTLSACRYQSGRFLGQLYQSTASR